MSKKQCLNSSNQIKCMSTSKIKWLNVEQVQNYVSTLYGTYSTLWFYTVWYKFYKHQVQYKFKCFYWYCTCGYLEVISSNTVLVVLVYLYCTSTIFFKSRLSQVRRLISLRLLVIIQQVQGRVALYPVVERENSQAYRPLPFYQKK